MRIIDRYLIREISTSLIGVTLILLLVTLGVLLGDTLADVARGSLPASLLFSQLGLSGLQSLTVLLPLSLFMAVMLSIGRLYRDSEMAVLAACGVSRLMLLRAVLWLVLPIFVILLAIAIWFSPWAQRTSQQMQQEAVESVSIVGLQPGRFHELAGSNSVVYVEGLAEDGVSFRNAFVHIDQGSRRDVVIARSGYQYQDDASGAKYLTLLDGFRAEGLPGQADFRWMTFERNDVRLPDVERRPLTHEPATSTLAELIDSAGGGSGQENGPATANQLAWAEIHWRLAPAFGALALALLAVPLARTNPRRGHYGNLLLGILAYVIYANLLAVGQALIEQGRVPHQLGLWWVHLTTIALALWLVWPKRRRLRHLQASSPQAGAAA